MFVLILHGESVEASSWLGQEEERPLTARGVAQAVELAAVLTGVGVRRLCCGPTVRGHQTLAPTAERLGLDVTRLPGLASSGEVGELLWQLQTTEAPGSAFAVHRSTLVALLDVWAATRRIPELPPTALTPAAAWGVWQYHLPQATLRLLTPQPAGRA